MLSAGKKREKVREQLSPLKKKEIISGNITRSAVSIDAKRKEGRRGSETLQAIHVRNFTGRAKERTKVAKMSFGGGVRSQEREKGDTEKTIALTHEK